MDTIDHISIVSVSCFILDGAILQANNISNNIGVRYIKDNQNVVIDFDYLDKNQGAVIQIVHTGLSSDDLHFRGDIKGVQKLLAVSPNKFVATPKLLPFIVSFSVRFVFTLIIIPILTYVGVFKPVSLPVMFIIVAVLYIFLDIIPFVFKIMRGRVMPKGLEKFNE